MPENNAFNDLLKTAGLENSGINEKKVSNMYSKLSESDRKKVENLLNDKQRLSKILDSPAARELIKKLSEK